MAGQPDDGAGNPHIDDWPWNNDSPGQEDQSRQKDQSRQERPAQEQFAGQRQLDRDGGCARPLDEDFPRTRTEPSHHWPVDDGDDNYGDLRSARIPDGGSGAGAGAGVGARAGAAGGGGAGARAGAGACPGRSRRLYCCPGHRAKEPAASGSGFLDLRLPWLTLTQGGPEPGYLTRLGPITPAEASRLARLAASDPAVKWRVVLTQRQRPRCGRCPNRVHTITCRTRPGPARETSLERGQRIQAACSVASL